MAARPAVAGRARGGEVIPAARASRPRLIVGAAALAALAGLVAYACLAASADLRPAALAAGGVGLLLLAVGVLLRKPWLVPWALAAVGGGYAVTRAGAHVVDGWAALVGAGLLLAGELGLSSAGDDPRIAVEGPLLRRRLVTTVALVAVAALVGFVLLGVAAVAASSGLVVAAAGVVAAVAAVGLVLRQLRAP